jgi:hypothetical protein
MEKYTKVEKLDLIHSLDFIIDDLERAKNLFAADAKGEILVKLFRLKDLRIKLILDFAPIKINPTDGTWARPCILCGTEANPRVIEWAYVDGKPICELCFKKYEPEAFEKAMKLDHDYSADPGESL